MKEGHAIHWERVLFFAIIALGIFLRFFNLGTPSYWVDELNHVYAAKSFRSEGSFDLPSGVPYPRAALFTVMVAGAQVLFGDNEFASRFPAAFFGVLTLILVFFVTKKILGGKVALLSLFFLAVLPLEVGWARLTRFYAPLQFVTVWAVAAFFWGMESIEVRKTDGNFWKSTFSFFFDLVKNKYIILSVVLFLLSFHLQVISAFVLVGIFGFTVFRFVENFFSRDEPVFLNRYFVIMVLFTLAVAAVWVLPFFRKLALYGLQFLPQWAKYEVAQDRFLFIKYIYGKDVFPLGAFFFLGLYQALFRKNHWILFLGLIFLIEIGLFSFVFKYRMYQYIYNVLPFFLMVSSYAIVNVFQGEYSSLNKKASYFHKFLRNPAAFVGVLLFFIPFTNFFQNGICIPFAGDGASNGAVTHLEWKKTVRDIKKMFPNIADYTIVSTLPFNVMHYLGKVDYDMNMNDYEVARENNLLHSGYEYYDMYSGKPFVLSVAHLDSLARKSKYGIVIADVYRFLSAQYVNPDLREYIEENFVQVYLSPKKSIIVFAWGNADSG